MSAEQRYRGNVAYYEEIAHAYELFFRDFRRNMAEEGRWLSGVLPEGTRDVLDACCGTGRQAIPLLQRGFRVIGADPSGAMLQAAAAKAQELGVDLPLIRSRFVDLPCQVGVDLDAVVALGNGLGNLTSRDEVIDSLRALRACCRRDGVCLIGIKDFDALRGFRRRVHRRGSRQEENSQIHLFERWEIAAPILTSTAALDTGTLGAGARWKWRVQTAQTHEYMLGQAELDYCAHRAGFCRVERLRCSGEATYALWP